MLRLDRVRIFLIGAGIIVLYLILNRLSFMAGSNTATGKVTGMKGAGYSSRTYRHGDYSPMTYPEVVFYAGGYRVTFYGESNMDLSLGETVHVIYKKSDPSRAWIYTFAAA